MGWDDDNEKGKKDRDPWGPNKNDEGPPDLDEVFENLQKKFKQVILGGGGSGGSGNRGGANATGEGSGMFFLLIFGLIAVLYIATGFYIVEPAEQAVVLRLGKYNRTVGSGPHWYPRFIESVIKVNTEQVNSAKISGTMLTRDENLVTVEVLVQYRIDNLENFIFKIANPMKSLTEASESSLRQAVGKNTLDFIITSGREELATEIEEVLIQAMNSYDSGIRIISVAYKDGKAPDQVKDAFDDATKAREDKERFILDAQAFSNKVLAEVKGQVQKMMKEAEAYKSEVVDRSKGEAERFNLVLPQYRKAPKVTKTRLHLETMEQVLSNSSKVIIDSKASNNMMYLPLDAMLKRSSNKVAQRETDGTISINPEQLYNKYAKNQASSNVTEDVHPLERRRRG